MEVRDIFRLRDEGRSEEAYQLIRERYRVHHGHYTTICMFWCAADVMKIRLNDLFSEEDPARRAAMLDEAASIFLSLQRLFPGLSDDDGAAAAQMYYLAQRLSRVNADFSLLLFLSTFGLDRLPDEDWLPEYSRDDAVRSRAAQMLAKVYSELLADPSPDNASRAHSLFAFALQRIPSSYRFRQYEQDALALLSPAE